VATAIAELSTHQLNSLEALLDQADSWDHLWSESGVALPTLRAKQLHLWLEHFAPSAVVRVPCVTVDGQLVAALPLVQRRVHGLMPMGTLPVNEWSMSGDLLLADHAADEHLDTLVSSLKQLPWQVLLLEGVCLESPRWSKFLAALDRARLPWLSSYQFEIGQVSFQQTWAEYQASWSANHRRHMRKAHKKAEADGGVELLRITSPDPAVVDEWMRRGFEIEDRSWKGHASGSSVLKTPGMFDFYCRQARELAASGQLCLTFLMHREEPIAFEYGWNSHGVYYTPKVGYDERFSAFTPGQLLRYLLLEQMFAEGTHSKIDYFGPLSDATAKWSTETYRISRLLVGTNRTFGAAAVHAAKLWQSRPRSN